MFPRPEGIEIASVVTGGSALERMSAAFVRRGVESGPVSGRPCCSLPMALSTR